VIIALLVFLMVRVYIKRNETQPPKWMGRLATATPGFFLTVLLVAIPLLILLLMGRRAEGILPKTRQWMNVNSWVVSELVIAFFLVVTISGLG
jgi:succinate dehydrogenase hydrophobic anchor subunit